MHIILFMIFLCSPSLAQTNSVTKRDKAAQVLFDNTPSQMELAKLQASGDTVKFYVIQRVSKKSTLTFDQFIRFPDQQKRNLVERAFYLACFSRAAEMSWTAEEVNVLNGLGKGRYVGEVIVEFEVTYFKAHGRWPPIVAVDVDSLNARILDDTMIR